MSEITSHSDAMNQAIAALKRAGVRFQQKTRFQLKIGPFSFYPGKGTIYRDGDLAAYQEKGLPAFLRLLRSAGLTKPNDRPVQPVEGPATVIPGFSDVEGVKAAS